MKAYLVKFFLIAFVNVTAFFGTAVAQVVQNNVPGLEIFPLEVSDHTRVLEAEVIINEAYRIIDEQVEEHLEILLGPQFCEAAGDEHPLTPDNLEGSVSENLDVQYTLQVITEIQTWYTFPLYDQELVNLILDTLYSEIIAICEENEKFHQLILRAKGV